uniref:hypothetical protein n=1 Tax=Flavobacterium sp. TaxID=239 RepID=UPI00404B12B1
MKSIIQNSFIFFVIISILCFNLKISILQFEYSFFNDSFTEQFCENKAKPELKCNGKCELKKISAEKENQESSKKIVTNTEVVFLNTSQNYNFFTLLLKEKKIIFAKKDFFKSEIYYPIEHPPQNFI